MALPSIETTNFTGLIKVTAATYTQPDFQAWIDETYPELVREILSDAALIEMQTTSPIADKYADLMEGVVYENEEGNQTINTGLANIVRYWIYWSWVIEQPYVNSSTGSVQNLNENSVPTSTGNNAAIAMKRYNKGVDWLCNELYPFIDFYKRIDREVTGFANLGGNLWRVDVPDTKYLSNGDTVSVDGVDYVVGNVLATSFEITSTETSFEDAYWEPFTGFNLPLKEYVSIT